MLERDLALAELTGASLIVDQISTADALASLKRAKDRGVRRAGHGLDQPSELQRDRHRRLSDLLQAGPPLRTEDDRRP